MRTTKESWIADGIDSLDCVDLFGRPRLRTHEGLAFVDVGGVSVKCLQLVDNVDNKSIAHVVTHDGRIVDCFTPPGLEDVFAEWSKRIEELPLNDPLTSLCESDT